MTANLNMTGCHDSIFYRDAETPHDSCSQKILSSINSQVRVASTNEYGSSDFGREFTFGTRGAGELREKGGPGPSLPKNSSHLGISLHGDNFGSFILCIEFY